MSSEAARHVLANVEAAGTAYERLTLLVLACYARSEPVRGEDGRWAFEAWPSLDTLAAGAGIDRRTIRRALAGLEKRGVLARVTQGSGRRTNLYRILAARGAPHVPREDTTEGSTRTPSADDGGLHTYPVEARGAPAVPRDESARGAPQARDGGRVEPPNTYETSLEKGFTDTHADARARHPSAPRDPFPAAGAIHSKAPHIPQEDDNASRVHCALRLLAELDVREANGRAGWTFAARLEARSSQHLPALTELAARYPSTTPDQLATHVLSAPVMAVAANRDADAIRAGLARARDALHGGEKSHDDPSTEDP